MNSPKTVISQILLIFLLFNTINGQSTTITPSLVQPSPSTTIQQQQQQIQSTPAVSPRQQQQQQTSGVPTPQISSSEVIGNIASSPAVIPQQAASSSIDNAAIFSSPTINQPTTTPTTSTTPTTTTTITTTTTSKPVQQQPSVTSLTYRITNDTSFCNGNGHVLEGVENPNMRMCSCFEDFHGLNCESDVDKILMKIVFGLAILAGILFILAIFIGCQWHSRLGEIEEKNIEVKELTVEKEILKKQNIDLKRRSPSPSGRPRSNYAPSNYAGSNYAASVMGSPNAGFYDDDRRSIINAMPSYDPSQKRLSAQLQNGDVALTMEDDGENTEDELDAITHARQKKKSDAVSIHSASTVNSEMVLLSSPRNQRPKNMRRPKSQEIMPSDAVLVNSRGYVMHQDNNRQGRSRSPSPRSHELSIENLRAFESGAPGSLGGNRGRARSLQDLRIIALNGEAQRQNPNGSELGSNLYKPRSIENILTGQVHRLAPRPKSPNGSVSSERPHGRGIFAQQQRRAMEDSSF